MLNKNINTPHWLQTSYIILVICLLAFSTFANAGDDTGITIETANIEQQNDTFLLNAKINYQLSSEAIDALSSGITLIFNVKFSVIEQRKWLWDKHNYTVVLPFQIKYHTLAETYQITDLTTSRQQNFSSLQSAINALGDLSDIPLHKLNTLKIKQQTGEISAYLNIEALPLPMRPVAYLTPAWHLSSNTFKWPLK